MNIDSAGHTSVPGKAITAVALIAAMAFGGTGTANADAGLMDLARADIQYVTTGERAREGSYPFSPYTAAVDSEVAQLAQELAEELAESNYQGPFGLRETNSIVTGWSYQREFISRGTVRPITSATYPAELYGTGANGNGAPDHRFELMAGEKSATATGLAVVGVEGEVIVVVINRYSKEPAVGPHVAPAESPTDNDANENIADFFGSLVPSFGS